jgi:hypothetical protein
MSKQNIISELVESKVIVEEHQLTINNEHKQTILLTKIKQLSIDGDIKYIRWVLLLLIPAGIILYAFGSGLPTLLKWLMLVIGGILGLQLLFGPPRREYLVINMKQGKPIRIPMNDKREDELEFIRKTNVHIYSLNKNN